MSFGSILAIVDPTVQHQPAVEKAAQLARSCGARLELHACETRESRHLRPPGAPTLEAQLHALAEPMLAAGAAVQVTIAAGDPLHAMLLEHARSSAADLVVKDTHHHSLAQRTFITHTDWHLIRGCEAPLLLVKGNAWQPQPVIAAAIDPGHVADRSVALDHRILERAQDLARQLGGSLQAWHAFLPLEAGPRAATAGGEMGVDDPHAAQATEVARATRQAELELFVRPYGIAPAAVQLRLGVASEVLPELARELQIDVLVMGAISRSGLAKWFIGSTAERVLEHLPCDVLIVKPSAFVPDAGLFEQPS
jgi:universal stress protein E